MTVETFQHLLYFIALILAGIFAVVSFGVTMGVYYLARIARDNANYYRIIRSRILSE